MAKQIKCNVVKVFIKGGSKICMLIANEKDPDQTFEFSLNKYASKTNAVFNDYKSFTLNLIKDSIDMPIYIKRKKDAASNEVTYKITHESKKDLIYAIKSAYSNQDINPCYRPWK